MTHLLFDADTLVYRYSAGNERQISWTDEDVSHFADPDTAAFQLDSYVAGLSEKFSARPVMCLSDPTDNWRFDLLPSYKLNRADFIRPMAWHFLREHIRRTYKTYEKPRLEGDDVLGILMTSKRIIKGDKVCVSIDKDLKTIPGRHFNPDKRSIFKITDEEALYNHLFQTLVGDRVDNYKGCPGIGAKRAQGLLQGAKAEGGPLWYSLAWEWVVEAFERKELTIEDALVQARVSRIMHAEDYQDGEIRYWQPPLIGERNGSG